MVIVALIETTVGGCWSRRGPAVARNGAMVRLSNVALWQACNAVKAGEPTAVVKCVCRGAQLKPWSGIRQPWHPCHVVRAGWVDPATCGPRGCGPAMAPVMAHGCSCKSVNSGAMAVARSPPWQTSPLPALAMTSPTITRNRRRCPQRQRLAPYAVGRGAADFEAGRNAAFKVFMF